MLRMWAIFGSIAAMQAVLAAPAMAQADAATAGADGLTDIVVTAQRRSENLQKVALSITAVSGDELLKRSVSQVEQLAALSPGLQVNASAGPYASFSVRSVSSLSGNAFADPAVAVNIGGVYLATPTVMHGLFYDLERVEILKGPQGTLYGRNATAGAINIIPHKPEFRTGASVYTEIGNLGRMNVGGALNLAASDTLAFRIAGQSVKRDGYMSDKTSDDDGEAVRASILFQPTPQLSILLSGDYAHQGGRGPGATIRKECAKLGRTGGACFVADPYMGITDLAGQYTSVGEAPPTRNQYIRGDYYGAALNIDYEMAFGTLTLLGGYREADNAYLGTGTSWQLRETQKPKQTSAELRLASNGTGPLKYVFGLYYLDTKIDARAQSENQQRRSFSDSDTHNKGWTWAAFTQITYALTDAFRLTGGLRYTEETKSTNSQRYSLPGVSGPDPVFTTPPGGTRDIALNEKRSWSQVNWKAGVEFDATDRNLIYANVSTGFKAGGFYYGPPGSTSYEPEKVMSYAVGTKNRFADNKIQLNLEAFYLDYKNQQVSFVKLVGPSAVLVTENAGRSHAYGLEFESQFLIGSDTRIGFDGAWVKASYDEFSYNTISPPSATSLCRVRGLTVDCSGLTPIRSPEWTLSGSFDQGFPLDNGGRLFVDGRGMYTADFYASTNYQIETLTNKSFRAGFGFGYEAPSGVFRARAFVDNAFDETTIANATVNTSYAQNNIVAINLMPPRTYGIQLSAKF